MRKWLTGSVIVTAAAVIVYVAIVAVPSEGQAPGTSYRAPRTPDGRPSLNGIWQAMGTVNWNLLDHPAQAGPFWQSGAIGAIPPGQGVVEGNEIPYQPSALAKKKQNAANWPMQDPEAKCYMPGVPRATYLGYPFQIVQTPKYILLTYQFSVTNRLIHMDDHTEAPVETWMGWSNGRWEGDTLVVDVTGLNGQSWLDRAGNFASENLHVVERYTPISPDHLQYEATIEDPTVFTRPWKISMPLYRRIERNVQLLEFKCVEFTEELLYGQVSKQSIR